MTQADWNVLDQALEQMSPGERLELIERVARSMRGAPPDSSSLTQHEAIQKLRAELATLTVRNPNDGFSGRDHDRLLYGGAS